MHTGNAIAANVRERGVASPAPQPLVVSGDSIHTKPCLKYSFTMMMRATVQKILK